MSHRKLVLVGAAVALLVTGAGVAVASGVTLPFSGDGNTINGCYASGGTLRVLTPAQPLCPDGFSPIHWNVTGPRGPQGTQGAQGQQGPAGTAGDVYTTYGERSTPSGNLFDVDTIAYLVLPPGTYELSAAIDAAPVDPSNTSSGVCRFGQQGSATFSPAGLTLFQSSNVESFDDNANEGTISLVGAVTVASGDVEVDCWSDLHDVYFRATLTATAVSAIHEQDH